MHDLTVYKEEPPIPADSRVFVDSGYQGFHHFHPDVDFPYKASKNSLLDKEKKTYNQVLSRVRVAVENIIGDIKVFKIMADRYRNKRKRYNLKCQIIAGIVNFKNGFSAI